MPSPLLSTNPAQLFCVQYVSGVVQEAPAVLLCRQLAAKAGVATSVMAIPRIAHNPIRRFALFFLNALDEEFWLLAELLANIRNLLFSMVQMVRNDMRWPLAIDTNERLQSLQGF